MERKEKKKMLNVICLHTIIYDYDFFSYVHFYFLGHGVKIKGVEKR